MADIDTNSPRILNSNVRLNKDVNHVANRKTQSAYKNQSITDVKNSSKINKSRSTLASEGYRENFQQVLKKAEGNLQSNDANAKRNTRGLGVSIPSSRSSANLPSAILPASSRLSNNLVQAGSNLAKQYYRDSETSVNDISLKRLGDQLGSADSQKNNVARSNGTDFALQEIALRFEQLFLSNMWNLAFRSDDREYEGGIGEELFTSELVSELVNQAASATDSRGNKVMGPIAMDVYNEMKRSK